MSFSVLLIFYFLILVIVFYKDAFWRATFWEVLPYPTFLSLSASLMLFSVSLIISALLSFLYLRQALTLCCPIDFPGQLLSHNYYMHLTLRWAGLVQALK